ncbi:MAG TPA: hypothetical protein VK752_33020 [Bryobacteraceae bacterium]|nr:hypothetical protein [Bryobacteraceae bacterium]
MRAWKDLYEFGARLGALHDVRRRQRAWEDHDALMDGELHDFSIEPRAGQETRTGIQAAPSPSKIEDRARINHHSGTVESQILDHIERARHGDRNYDRDSGA